MDKKIKVKIVAPTKKIYEGEADLVIMRTKTGDLGVLKGHENLSTVLDLGILRIIEGDEEQKIALLGGFTEVSKEGVSILTDSAELYEDIDVERAIEAKKRAEKRIADKKESTDIKRAEIALKRALVRIELKK